MSAALLDHEPGHAAFTRMGKEWGLVGNALVEGQVAVVRKKDGSTTLVTVGTILSELGEGRVIATVKRAAR